MEMLFVVLIFLLSISLILLVMFQPRQQQSLSTDTTSNLGEAKLLASPSRDQTSDADR